MTDLEKKSSCSDSDDSDDLAILIIEEGKQKSGKEEEQCEYSQEASQSDSDDWKKSKKTPPPSQPRRNVTIKRTRTGSTSSISSKSPQSIELSISNWIGNSFDSIVQEYNNAIFSGIHIEEATIRVTIFSKDQHNSCITQENKEIRVTDFTVFKKQDFINEFTLRHVSIDLRSTTSFLTVRANVDFIAKDPLHSFRFYCGRSKGTCLS